MAEEMLRALGGYALRVKEFASRALATYFVVE
jgi:hypothetical protein